MQNKTKAIIAFVIAAFGYSTISNFGKLLSQYLTSFDVVLARIVIGVVIAIGLLLALGEKIEFPKKDRLKIFLMGFFGFGIMTTFFMTAVYFTSVANAAFLVSLHPITAILLSYKKIKKRIWNYIAFAVVSLVGVSLLIGFSRISTFSELMGCLFAVIASFAYGVYLVIGRDLRGEHSLGQLVWLGIFAIPFLIITSAIFGNPSDFLSLGIIPWLYILGLAVFGTVIALGLPLYGLKHISATSGSMITLLEPLFATFLAFLIFSDYPTMLSLIGGVLIIAGAALIIREDRKNENPTA